MTQLSVACSYIDYNTIHTCGNSFNIIYLVPQTFTGSVMIDGTNCKDKLDMAETDELELMGMTNSKI